MIHSSLGWAIPCERPAAFLEHQGYSLPIANGLHSYCFSLSEFSSEEVTRRQANRRRTPLKPVDTENGHTLPEMRHPIMVHLKVLTPNNWCEWRALRVFALTNTPEAFVLGLADWQSASEQRRRHRLTTVPLM